MRSIDMLSMLAMLLLAGTTAICQHHAPPEPQGSSVMGCDQSQTEHHFSLFRDAGAIEVTVREPADGKNRDAIRSHLRHIAIMFADGDFDAPMLVHDSNHVPGTAIMA